MAGSGSIATKNGDYVLVNTAPDVCWTKVGKKWRPIPYNITHTMANSENVSPNVFAGGKPAFMHGESFITGITGDEPGRRGGIVTGTLTEISFALDKSASVHVNGMKSVRTGDCVWMNQQTPAAKQGKVGPDGQTSWLKIQGVYKDRWRTPIHSCPVVLSINESSVPFTALSGGEGYNSAASSEAMAVETKDQPGTVVRQNVEPGSVKVEGVENKELEEATLELKASLRESFGFELKKLNNAMFPFQQDWKKYGGSSAYIASAKGNIVGAERWFQDLVNTGDVFDNINFEDVKNGTISILSRAIPGIGISFWLSEGFQSGDFSAWFKSEMEERRAEMEQIASLVKSSAENIVEIADYSVKIYKHEKEIKEFLVHLHEANIDDVELFVENVIGDIDPKLAKDIMTNTDNHSVFLEYFGDSIGREFAAFLARVIEIIPPNFYFFLVGAAGFYILLEVIFGIILGLLFAPAAAGRLALIIARLTQIGKATIAVTKVKGTALAIEAFLNILEFIKNSIDLLKTIGKNLRIIRSPELKKEGQTGETLLIERSVLNLLDLDDLFGDLRQPYPGLKEYETIDGRITKNPKLQIIFKGDKAIPLEKGNSYIWVVDKDGNLRIGTEEKIAPGQKLGHPSLVEDEGARVGGEIKFNSETKEWRINDKSGRFSRGRTKEERTKILNNVHELFLNSGLDVGVKQP